VTCCWFSYWNTAPGPASGGSDPFVEWFLDQVRHHDEAGGARTLDVLDVHYYPQSNVFNDDTDSETAARRLRSVRSLYDSDYADESWIGEPIWFIPRMLETIENHYPGTRLGITEWNFGADRSMNGALAIADALGIFGREGVFLASYWQYPEPGSPGSFAFAIHGNYDGAGSSFSGIALPATSPDVDVLASFAALDPDSGHLKVMLINKQLDQNLTVRLELTGFAATTGTLWRYSSAEPNEIVREDTGSGSTLEVRLPAYSITLVDLSP
jgi:hypothetical protein